MRTSIILDKNPRKQHFIGAAIAGATALGSGIAGAISGNKNSKRAIRAQQEENEKTRAFNLNLANQANQWSIEQWNRENQYNAPSNQRKLLAQGGLNPDLYYGANGVGLGAAHSPAVTSSAPAQSTDMSNLANLRTVGDVVQNGMTQYYQNRLAEASLEKTEAETQKVKADAEGVSKQNEWIDKLNQNTINLGNSEVTNMEYANRLSDAQKTAVNASLEKIHAEVDNLRAASVQALETVKNMKFNQGIQAIKIRIEKSLSDAQIKKLAADTGLSYQEINRVKETLPYLIGSLVADNENKTAQGMLAQQQRMNKILEAQGIRIQNGNLVLNGKMLEHAAKNAEAYDKSTDNIGIVGSTIRVATQLIQDVFGGTIGNLVK
nr:MAG TPA: DNA pilot protein VP2 [Microviridae sp.]